MTIFSQLQNMNPATIAVIGLGVFLILWYIAAHMYNRRRGRYHFNWLEKGLDVLGGERESGWIGSPNSGARINVTHAAPPFRRLEITLLLANRESPLLWLFDYLRRKRDRLIIRATLRSPRRGKVEITHARKKSTHPQERQREGPHGLIVTHQGHTTQQQIARLEAWLANYGMHVQRFIWRKSDPHIQLQVRIAGLLTTPSETFLADLQAALKRVS